MQKGACNSISRHTNEGRLQKREMNATTKKIGKNAIIVQNRKVILSRSEHGQDRPALSIQGPWGPRPMTPRGLKSSTPP